MGGVGDFPAPLDGVCVTGLNSLERGADLRGSFERETEGKKREGTEEGGAAVHALESKLANLRQ